MKSKIPDEEIEKIIEIEAESYADDEMQYVLETTIIKIAISCLVAEGYIELKDYVGMLRHIAKRVKGILHKEQPIC